MFCISTIAAAINFGQKLGGQGPKDWFVVFIMLELTILLPAVLLVSLIALIPAKGKRYWQRFWARAPYIVAIVTGSALVAYTLPIWYPALMGIEQLADTDLSAVSTAAEQDCGEVRDGVFENKGMRIAREGEHQVQYDKLLGTTDTFAVIWISPCQYELRKQGVDQTMLVKITHVDQNGYDCVFGQSGGDRLVYSLRLDRVH